MPTWTYPRVCQTGHTLAVHKVQLVLRPAGLLAADIWATVCISNGSTEFCISISQTAAARHITGCSGICAQGILLVCSFRPALQCTGLAGHTLAVAAAPNLVKHPIAISWRPSLFTRRVLTTSVLSWRIAPWLSPTLCLGCPSDCSCSVR